MCGIVGYVGTEQAAPILLSGLQKLEYRGYDSAGIAIWQQEQERFEIVRSKGRLQLLAEKTDDGKAVPGLAGIGHTRWATHGEPSEKNAHPHHSDDGSVVLVHNGIIENYQELKDKLLAKGYRFYSDTDTEIAVKLVDYYYKKWGDPLEALSSTMFRVRGSYAFGVMFKDHPGMLYAARKDSPLIIGSNETGNFIASDVPAILDQTRQVYYIGNMEMATLSEKEIHFYNIDRQEIHKELMEIRWDASSAEKGGYEHFMLKEIHEQPEVIKETMNAYVKEGKIDFSGVGITDDKLKQIRRIYMVACGSAYHVSMTAKYIIEKMAGIPVEVDLASEFRYRDPILEEDSLLIAISQSGETADTLEALRLAQKQNVEVLGIVNVVGSSIARESNYVLYTHAGPEIAVATTKAYSCQLIAVYLIAIHTAYLRGKLNAEACGNLLAEMAALPKQVSKILEDKERIQWFASKYANAHDIFFIGRGIDYAISLEGSLKMKEISYIHSEAYAAGELKHGTISLIENNTLVIGILTQKNVLEKTVSNLVETKARGAYLMGVTTYGNYSVEDTVDFSVYVPATNEYFTASLALIPLQLMGYYVSLAKGLDVDKPRNLAKSVTVE